MAVRSRLRLGWTSVPAPSPSCAGRKECGSASAAGPTCAPCCDGSTSTAAPVLESLLRVLLCRAGLAPPETQLVLRDPQDRRDHDRRRDNTCARLGWLVLRFSWADVAHRPEQVVGAVRAALATAARA